MENDRKSGASRLFKAVFIILAVFVVLAAAVVFGYSFFGGSENGLLFGLFESPAIIENIVNPVKQRTTFLLLGVDEDGTRTDTIITGCYDAVTKKIEIVSIPRDTRVKMAEDRILALTEEGRYVPKSGYMKINQVHHYAGSELGVSYVKMQMEELLGIEIDYYVKINTEAFRILVDEIGGVWFDVPQRMIYDDPEQNLHIDLYPGMQLLNGEQAEGLVRYRHGNYGSADETATYPMADLDRVKVQQQFMTALAESLSKGNVIKNMGVIADIALKYVDTNLKMSDITKYARNVKDIDVNNISAHTLPCTAKRIDGTEYAVTDEDEIKEFVEQVFYRIEVEMISVDYKELKLTVLNGAGVSGLAAKNRDLLEEQGYNVTSIGDYYGEKMPYTRILVKDNIDVSGLADMYPASKTEVDKNLEEIYNVIIILGTDEGS